MDPYLPRAVRLVRTERERQVLVEGYDPAAERNEGSTLIAAGRVYAGTVAPEAWPWDRESYKPKGAVRDMVRAGALFLAAIDASQERPWTRQFIQDRYLDPLLRRLARTLAEAEEALR